MAIDAALGYYFYDNMLRDAVAIKLLKWILAGKLPVVCFSDLQLRQINDQMILVERSFVDPNGLLVDHQNR